MNDDGWGERLASRLFDQRTGAVQQGGAMSNDWWLRITAVVVIATCVAVVVAVVTS